MAELEAKGLCTGHAYSILDACQLPSGEQVVQLRNPWGTFECRPHDYYWHLGCILPNCQQ